MYLSTRAAVSTDPICLFQVTVCVTRNFTPIECMKVDKALQAPSTVTPDKVIIPPGVVTPHTPAIDNITAEQLPTTQSSLPSYNVTQTSLVNRWQLTPRDTVSGSTSSDGDGGGMDSSDAYCSHVTVTQSSRAATAMCRLKHMEVSSVAAAHMLLASRFAARNVASQ